MKKKQYHFLRSFQDEASARDLQRLLKEQGFGASVFLKTREDGHDWRVDAYVFCLPDESEKAVERLRMALPPAKVGRDRSGSLRTVYHWDAVDWSEPEKDVVARLGCDISTYRYQRSRRAP